MEKSMHRFMKPGIILGVSYKELGQGSGPILETLKKLVTDPYFECIELSHMQDPEVFRQAAEMIHTANMVTAIGGQGRLLGPGLNINDLDEDRRMQAVKTLKDGIDEAYIAGAVDFQFLAGRYETDTIEASMQALFRSTEELCAYAASKGDLKIVCEVFDYDVAKKSLIGPVDRVKRYAETIGRKYDNFGIQVDLSHIPILRESIEESILPIAKYIKHAHIGNAVVADPSYPAYGDEHPRFGFPHSEVGVPEIVKFLRTLLEIGFLNESDPPIVSFEVKPFGAEDPDVVLANAKRTLDRAWELV